MAAQIKTDIREIVKILREFWKDEATYSEPKFIPLLFFVRNSAGELVGFAYAHDINDGYFREIHFDDLYIDKRFRNMGYGTTLTESLIKYAKFNRIPSISVCIDKGNRYTLKLCKKMGFRENRGHILLHLDLFSRRSSKLSNSQPVT